MLHNHGKPAAFTIHTAANTGSISIPLFTHHPDPQTVNLSTNQTAAVSVVLRARRSQMSQNGGASLTVYAHSSMGPARSDYVSFDIVISSDPIPTNQNVSCRQLFGL